jgi:hypothetical protein
VLSEPAPFLRDPLIKIPSGTTDKIHDHNDYPPYHIPHQKHTVSYFTSLTLISEPPTFLTRGGVPGSYDRTYQLFTTKKTTATTTELSRRNNTTGRGYHHATSSASRGSPPARWCVCRSQELAGGEYYSAASSRSKVGLVLSPILTQAPGRCLC